MNFSKIVDISQVIGVVAIIASLVFIGIEINHNTKTTRASIRQSIATNDITYLSTYLNSGIIAEALAKQIDSLELNTKEFEQMVMQQYVNFIVFETAFYNYQSGFVDEGLWNRYRIIISVLLQDEPFKPYAIEALKRFEHTFTEAFRNEVKSISKSLILTE